MGRFKNIYAPIDMVSAPCTSQPRFLNQLGLEGSGHEQVNEQWEKPRWRFNFPEVIREHGTYARVRNHFLVMRGVAHTWPFRDALDFASAELETPNVEPLITEVDHVIGFGDGSTDQPFQLIKTYESGTEETDTDSFIRKIVLPLLASVVVAVDGELVDPANYTVTRPGGILTFNFVPTLYAVVTAGYLFDCLVRYEQDDIFQGIIQKNGIAGYADLALIEVPICRDEA